MNFKWFASRNARTALDMCKHVQRMLDAQRDILTAQAISAIETALRETRTTATTHADDETIKKAMANLEDAANKWLKPYPNASIRENVEVLLVALAVAMAIRTFFVQPFKIPTGSMQPTLFGVTTDNLKQSPDIKIPGLLRRIYEGCVLGKYYHYLVAEDDGELVKIAPPGRVMFFIHTQTITMHYPGGNKDYTFWMTPDDARGPGDNRFGDEKHAGISEGQPFHKGEEIVNFREIAGDHLFVDRVTYNFRHPTRGEIIVFETRGIGNAYFHLPPDQFYIKRMVAMGGENVQIGNDRHLTIDGQRLDKSTPHFEKVYSFDPNVMAKDSHYSGHLNQYIAGESGLGMYNIAPLFPTQETTYQIQPDHYMVMGDNTANSFDSRAWGEFSRTNVIGKYFFVYWPLTERFGWSVK